MTRTLHPTRAALAAAAATTKTTMKGTTAMTATTTATVATVPTTTARPKMTWAEAKARRESARAMVGYDKTSPIWGKTTVEVATWVTDILADTAVDESTRISEAVKILLELRKRETAEKIAFA